MTDLIRKLRWQSMNDLGSPSMDFVSVSQIFEISLYYYSLLSPQTTTHAENVCRDLCPWEGAMFKEYAPFFKMYSDYVANHEKASELLTTLHSNAQFQSLTQSLQDSQQQQQSLTSLLIMPVQRVPRYKLLLQELLKQTPPDHPDTPDLRSSLQLIGAVADHINEEVRQQEKRDEIRLIEAQFYGYPGFLDPGRILIRHGVLTKKSRHQSVEYHFFLFNDMIAYALPLPLGLRLNRKLEIDQHFRLEVVDQRKRGATAVDRWAFQLRGTQKSIEVYARDGAERDAWIQDIQACIRNQTLRRISRGLASGKSGNRGWERKKDMRDGFGGYAGEGYDGGEESDDNDGEVYNDGDDDDDEIVVMMDEEKRLQLQERKASASVYGEADDPGAAVRLRSSSDHRQPRKRIIPAYRMKPIWQQDKDAPTCSVCGFRWTLFNRRHHVSSLAYHQ